ncbi:hypothetical protein V502_00705 [Pseudogymnoascus sp. VKM F-4520 (FW-2644)]|nr:hypothetical protein V502_00705 [Pseudogymnoascus sp. VKM F-4520 (FW-2644)]
MGRSGYSDGHGYVVEKVPIWQATGLVVTLEKEVSQAECATWIGSKILGSIIGEHKKADPVKLQAESIAQISLAFQKALETERLQEAADKLEGLTNNIEEYNNAPATSLFRLQDAATDSLDLFSTLVGLKSSGLSSYLVAVGIRITILQDLQTAGGTFQGSGRAVRKRYEVASDFGEEEFDPVSAALGKTESEWLNLREVTIGRAKDAGLEVPEELQL